MSRTNFYKNAAYAYAKEFGLSSALENLRTYQIATGEVPISAAIEDPAQSQAPPLEGRKALPKAAESQWRKRKRVVDLEGAQKQQFDDNRATHSSSHIKDSSTELHEYRDNVCFVGSIPKLTSALGFAPYDSIEDPCRERATNSGKVELLSCSLASTVFGGLAYGRGLEDDNNSEEDSPSCNDHFLSRVCDTGAASNEVLGEAMEGVVARRKDQRFAAPGEPCCVVCGRYGAYICDETSEDICSMECKDELLQEYAVKQAKEARENRTSFVSLIAPRGALLLPEASPDCWDYEKHCWRTRSTCLSTYKCWKCGRAGHLPTDCLATKTLPAALPANPTHFQVPMDKDPEANTISRELRSLYKKSKKIATSSSNAKCSICHRPSNLAMCMDCDCIICDSSGHLIEHLAQNSSHRQLYSYKLQCVVKCCKSTCEVTDIRELLCCHYCLNKAFDKYYNMYTATWKGQGLKYIRNSVCCDEHFTWHRTNCAHVDVEKSASLYRGTSNHEYSQFNYYLF